MLPGVGAKASVGLGTFCSIEGDKLTEGSLDEEIEVRMGRSSADLPENFEGAQVQYVWFVNALFTEFLGTIKI